ncbi:MAG: GNAT family N-acetyltransferase [Bacteroidota bacterium]
MPETLPAIEIREGLDGITPARVATLYRRAPLLRPTGSAEQLQRMFEQSSLVLSAWMGNRLVGLARVMTDGVQFSFLCDLAVEPDVQGVGLGRQLIEAVLAHCRGTELILRDSDISAGFYQRLGFAKITNAWMRRA